MTQHANMSDRSVGATAPAAPGELSNDSFFVQAVEEYLLHLEAGERPDRQTLLEQFPDVADKLGEFLDGLDFVHEVAPQLSESSINETSTGPKPVAIGDFRIVREIGRGGMGVVYEAEQLSLDRRVALKVLPYASVLDNRQLLRFKNEAQAAAQLRHPNIVGVHFVGCERSVHYYAMELIEGKSLAELLADERRKSDTAHQSVDGKSSAPQASPSDETHPVAELSTTPSVAGREHVRSIARLAVQAARALEYAHDTGLIHRDIKPSNLLVDSGGHLWVTDFGLATTHQTDAGLTLTGDLLGTLRYMSPEQAAGDRSALDHRTDIYSLGVTLYESLTLRVPFVSPDRQRLLQSIMEREPRPPRQIRTGVPKDLETIVLKAMAKEPADRYRTAREMADDLERFLNDKPVQARRPSIARRLTKWSHRHRAALTISVCVLGVLLSVGAILLWQQRGRTLVALAQAQRNFQDAETQRREAEQQRQLAETHSRRVHETVETMLMSMAEGLINVPHTEGVQQALLGHALAYYEGFLRERPMDRKVRFDTAQAYLRIAEVADRMTQRERQEHACREAVVLMTRLVQDYPEEPKYVELLALAHQSLGRCEYRLEEIQQSKDDLRKALAICETLASHPDTEGFFRRALAGIHTELGFTLTSTLNEPSQYEQGLIELRRGLELRKKLASEFGFVEYGADLAESHGFVGKRLVGVGRISEAEPHIKKAVGLLTRLASDSPSNLGYAISLAGALADLGNFHRGAGRPKLAVDAFQRCVEVRRQITGDFAAFYKQRERLAIAYEVLGETLIQSGRSHDAEIALRDSLEVRELLNEEFYPVHDCRGGISWGHHELALVFQASGRPVEAEYEFREAMSIRQSLVQERPTDVRVQRYLAWGKYELGLLLTELGRTTEAGELYRQSLTTFERLVASDSPSSTTRMWFVSFLIDCPDSRYADAERAVGRLRQLLEENPTSADVWNMMGRACYRARRWQEAIAAFNKSTELRSKESDLVPCHEWLFLGAAHWQLGDKVKAREWYGRTLTWIRDNGHNEQYNDLGRWLPEVSALLGEDWRRPAT